MSITTLSGCELKQDAGRAIEATAHGPVIITDRGLPKHVLLSFEDYQRLSSGPRNVADDLESAMDLRVYNDRLSK